MTAANEQSAHGEAERCDCGAHEAGHSCDCGGHEAAAHSCDCGGESEGDACSCGGEHDACTCGGHETTAAAVVCKTPHHAAPSHSCSCQSVKLPRKIHAASGLVFGIFLVAHLLLNSSALEGTHFRSTIDFVHGIIHALPGITLVLVFIPLMIQIITGLYLLYMDGLKYTPNGCTRGSKPRFFLQRVSGLAILIFVALHLGTLHGWSFHPVARAAGGPLAGYNPTHLFPAAGWISGILYLICIWAAVYHIANGSVTGSMVWGVVKKEAARANLRKLSAVCGVILAILGTLAWIAFGATGALAG